MKTKPDSVYVEPHCLLDLALHPGDTTRHGVLTVRSNRKSLSPLFQVENVQCLGGLVEKLAFGLAVVQKKRHNVNIGQRSIARAEENLQIHIGGALDRPTSRAMDYAQK